MIKIIAKFAFAITIIGWLLRSGKLDLSLISQILDHPFNLSIVICVALINSLLTSYRWKLLLDNSETDRLPLSHTLRLTWIGIFFSTVLPGAVTGDLIKLAYAKNINKNSSGSFLLSSIFLDRILGLSGLIFVLGFFTSLNYHELVSKSNELAALIHFNLLLLFATFLFFISIFIHSSVQNFILYITKKIPLAGEALAKVFGKIWIIGGNKKTIFFAVAISIVVQTISVISFYYLVSPFAPNLSLAQAFTFIPIGFITIAIPISPQGLGVGHLIFATLFSLYEIVNGASLFNIYFVATVIINLFGCIPYLTARSEKTINN
ncbi:MAG: hypothetical protein A2504_03910 [Bdellovibrionales bacterium RIFOXYD12_FULL_39_22]|nr:MAG: hypothetical protein A2385_11660 [Bdellovibrionales bacterium RIFOXYB1_FULL_39_21]OFZ41722.1 MAG: hypothetical protein A2485_01970 [Bdellovibrionales bacterium RIFOXYC12_FULL_39_17]OFZ46122.1 MAG: hypothetical protein A2404_12335 [Bdellovibrionales bacterium RIFOXYC1_FULL_39_130]OFZ74949.1 MAG: hypothetical protein A2560_15375 [Bdellovibrionales bacterium RIFOXYD1_FULL_39_84]OFZ92802.1 MAG: hypothetical protein A2504_03910 [Bdellovibrionales bacterium RIFOXYD12_FULL_39_22]HLE12591.1 ly